jgi:hypothetical protein
MALKNMEKMVIHTNWSRKDRFLWQKVIERIMEIAQQSRHVRVDVLYKGEKFMR